MTVEEAIEHLDMFHPDVMETLRFPHVRLAGHVEYELIHGKYHNQQERSKVLIECLVELGYMVTLEGWREVSDNEMRSMIKIMW